MRRHSIFLRTVALMATVVFLGGFPYAESHAKTTRKTNTSNASKMNAPDFAYPKTVEKNASVALEKAIAIGDWPAAIDATIQLVTADNIVSHGNAEKGLSKIDSVASVSPEAWRPAFMLIKADVYSSIYGSIRWKADSRKLPLDSVPANPYDWSRDIFADKVLGICSELLESSPIDSTPLKEWGKFMENTADANALYLTVDEFVCSRCFSLLGEYSDATRDIIPFFNTVSTPLTTAQKCSDLRDKAIDRLIASTSGRGQSLLLAQALSDKADILPYSMRMKYLVEAFERVKGTEGEQLILTRFRDFINEDAIPGMESPFPYSKKEYIEMLRKSVADFPKGRYVNSLKNIINDFTRPFSEIRYKGQYLTSSDIKMDVRLSNCNESWILVYDYSPFVNKDDQPKNREIAARCRLVKAVKVSVEGNVPFSSEATATLGQLLKGTYVVIPSATSDSKGIYANILDNSWREPFTVSDISVMTLQTPDAKTRVFVVDGSNGRPIEGAEVKVYTRKNYSSPRRLVNTQTTDSDGSVTVSEQRFEIEALYNGSKWNSDTRYFNSATRRDTTVRKNVQILADRSLCHPGDSLQAVVVAYSSHENGMHLNEGASFDIILRDTN
ncbi:MAG: hypothetical protein K2M16_00125, partial [Muribaculaceae bacterium]|nr:hypothetical protein [Muribaculaceae bacterium]